MDGESEAKNIDEGELQGGPWDAMFGVKEGHLLHEAGLCCSYSQAVGEDANEDVPRQQQCSCPSSLSPGPEAEEPHCPLAEATQRDGVLQ